MAAVAPPAGQGAYGAMPGTEKDQLAAIVEFMRPYVSGAELKHPKDYVAEGTHRFTVNVTTSDMDKKELELLEAWDRNADGHLSLKELIKAAKLSEDRKERARRFGIYGGFMTCVVLVLAVLMLAMTYSAVELSKETKVVNIKNWITINIEESDEWSNSTLAPTVSPTVEPTALPTVSPTVSPSAAPSVAPTAVGTQAPTAAPTFAPTPADPTPFIIPSEAPTPEPTNPEFDDFCQAGIKNRQRTHCCPTTCGSCGNQDCKERPGGFYNCCTQGIDEVDTVCDNNTQTSCRMWDVDARREVLIAQQLSLLDSKETGTPVATGTVKLQVMLQDLPGLKGIQLHEIDKLSVAVEDPLGLGRHIVHVCTMSWYTRTWGRITIHTSDPDLVLHISYRRNVHVFYQGAFVPFKEKGSFATMGAHALVKDATELTSDF